MTQTVQATLVYRYIKVEKFYDVLTMMDSGFLKGTATHFVNVSLWDVTVVFTFQYRGTTGEAEEQRCLFNGFGP